MEFYRVLSKFYDEIFPLKEPQKKFLKNYLTREKINSVLDVGCGSGSYVLELAGWGIRTMGVDLSPEMVNIARAKVPEQDKNSSFAVGNMLDLTGIPGQFDGVLCLGNTLAHLIEPGELSQALNQFKQKGKHLLLQVVNYDRVLAKQITELPEITTPNLVFRRFYEHLPSGLIKFSMEIELGDKTKLSEANTLSALTRDALTEKLVDAGWRPTEWWGSFAGEEWSSEAPATIVSAVG
ncbi:MAG TPA: class I SAM-dependent methyltransferase [Verrucomicrobiae bacterium]|nr:class I SAM-dependent methyltransferase [Verrucomicrobiae bacterium]